MAEYRRDDYTGKQTNVKNLRKVREPHGDEFEVRKEYVEEVRRGGQPTSRKKNKWKRRIVAGSGGH
jgi:hypothetical protein